MKGAPMLKGVFKPLKEIVVSRSALVQREKTMSGYVGENIDMVKAQKRIDRRLGGGMIVISEKNSR